MAEFTVTTIIDRPQEDVFAFMSDPANAARWQSGTRSADRACRRQVHDGCVDALWLVFRYDLEDAALTLAEERYLNDRCACFPETDDAWDRLERWADLILGLLSRADRPGRRPTEQTCYRAPIERH